MYNYDLVALSSLLQAIIEKNVSPDTFGWLTEKAAVIKAEKNKATQLNLAFVSVPRKTGRSVIAVSEEEINALQSVRPQFHIRGWTIDRLCRVWLLLQLDATDETNYIRIIENLFPAAEMNELVALYSALPVLAYPEAWRKRCAEGIRSNIGMVLESIMCYNPFASENLDDAAWNQLVLKAFFTDKPINKLIGLDKRANSALAHTLSDYAHERWAAHRQINPQLWRCVGPFIDEKIYPDIERIAHSENTIEREAAALACSQSSYGPAKQLLEKMGYLKTLIESGSLTWDSFAQKTASVS
jgi:hypothetical protein